MGIIAIGTVRGSEVAANKDADENSRLLQVEITNADDLQTIEQLGATGEDSNPQPGARVIVLDLGPAYRVAVALSDEVEPSVDAGEKELYSYDASGGKLAYIKMLSNSVVEINDNADNAVAFKGLQTAFDQLKSDFNDLVTAYNAHIHLSDAINVSLAPATIQPVAVGGSPSTASIAGAKINSIEVPEGVGV